MNWRKNWNKLAKTLQRSRTMPKRVVIVDYKLCQPGQCSNGVCRAALACPRKVLKQDGPYEMPDFNPAMCVGCGVCAQACPRRAVRVM
ncbi:MAG: 4Fe-4S binding protein [Anaerolineae bacterium]